MENAAIGNAALVPLTPMQMRLLYDSVQRVSPGTHLEQLVCHFDDAIPDPQRMSQAWQRLTDRHPVLRCACIWKNTSAPHLRPVDGVKVRLKVERPTSIAETARGQWMARWLTQDRARGIDINSTPAWRLNMVVWGERAFTLVWTFHHLWLDGPGMALLLREVLRDYLDGPSAQSDVPAGTSSAPSFADHAFAVAKWRATPHAVHTAQQFFGQMFRGVSLPAGQSLAGRLPGADIVSDTAPVSSSGRMGMQATRLPASALARLEKLGQTTNSSLATVIYAAWALILSRWTGQPDAVFGVVRSGRHLLAGARETVGCLINTLPIRVPLRRGLTLADLLSHIRAITIGMRPHEHADLHDIRQWCDLDANADLLGSTVLFEPQPLHRRLSVALASRARFELHEQGSSELSLLAYVDDGIDLRLEFDAERFKEDTVDRVLMSARLLLESMADAVPHIPLAALGSNSLAQIDALSRWATPAEPVDNVTTCAVTLFEKQARLTPHARAVSHGEDWLSFEQLNAQADQLAHWLMRQEVKPGDRVALCLPRGIPFIKAMLAVMKSGMAWVPIDPGYPDDVIQHMVSDCSAAMLLTTRAGQTGLRFERSVALEDIPATSDSECPPGNRPIDRPAYVIYTSGSTGKPKGVIVGHRALASHAQAVIAHYGLQPHDRVLQFASLSFDVSIEEIAPTLLAGAELVLRTDSAAETIPEFLQLVQARQITVLNLPTAFWHVLVEQMELSGSALPATVRLLVVGGEKASRGMLERWWRIEPRRRWINAYGPTEATISCASFELAADSCLPPGPDIPIGRPFGHARVVVLAADGSLAPPGARGELVIGGPALADGYLGLEATTAGSFITTTGTLDPWLTRLGLHRVYFTGDEAHWDEEGLLHYLGRRDRQVKLRGFRVELREVEAAIEQIDGVSQCIAHVDRPGELQAQLLAWVLPHPESHLTVPSIENALARSLPPHMRPAIKLVSEWPTTAGGKIDLKRLPGNEPSPAPASAAQEHTEEVFRMAKLFAMVLELDSVDPQDSFFDLGGHSLSALRLVAAVAREFGREVTLSNLKSHPTPAALSAALTTNTGKDGPRFLVTIEAGAGGLPLYGIHSLGHRERFYRPLARRLGPAQPLFGLTTGYTHLHETPLSIEELARLYFEDIQKHQPQGPLVLMAVSMCAYVAYELAKMLTSAGRPPALLVLFDAEGPDGRPRIKHKHKLLALHWKRLREQGPRYLMERLSSRLTRSGGHLSYLGIALAKRLGIEREQEYDHPADHAFVENLARSVHRYAPRGYAGDMLIFCAEDNLFFDLDKARQNGMGWGPYCGGSVRLSQVPGGHISMLDEPHVAGLAAQMTKLMQELAPHHPQPAIRHTAPAGAQRAGSQ